MKRGPRSFVGTDITERLTKAKQKEKSSS
uniref:Uncharacterized protein n=1 Tax=Rhizophora mucronata TaxID=61149 RepID=A0A2P2QMS7_RHIMU